MASKSAYQSTEKGAEIEEQLDQLETLLERLRSTYEQYFLGIQKLAPSQLHLEAERRVRDLTQIQIKNTALRYRYATLSQKFGAYNMYWKRTLRMIEQGRYVRDLQRIKRAAEKSGDEIPEEILAAMPKMMRERVQRDRANVVKVAERQGKTAADPTATKASGRQPGNVHRLDEALVPDDVDVDGLFAALTKEAEDALDAAPLIITSKPPRTDPELGVSELEPEGPTSVRPPPHATRPATRPPPLPPARPRTQSAAAASRPGTPPPTAQSSLGPPPGMNDDETRALYTRYLKARELCGEKNDGVTYDKLLRTLRSQSTKIMTDHKAKGVEFGVVIKDNKVVLKAKPKI